MTGKEAVRFLKERYQGLCTENLSDYIAVISAKNAFDIAELIKQLQAEVDGLKCCGNCAKWNVNWTYTGIDFRCDDRVLRYPESTDTCKEWLGVVVIDWDKKAGE